MDRFSRTEQLLGKDAFERIGKSYVVVVGLGAVGGYAVEGLARAGIGHLRLVDFDKVAKSNINRQILALESSLGQLKCEAAVARVKEINPACQVEGLPLFADVDNIEAILDPKPDLIIDAIDALNPKVQLLFSAIRLGIPVLSSMGAALRTDPARIAFGDISESCGCPLAKRVRKRLRRQGISSGIGCVYSSEPVEFNYTGPEEDDDCKDWRGRQRNILGSLPTITGIFGLILANQSILLLSE